jgi:hypothetical protein
VREDIGRDQLPCGAIQFVARVEDAPTGDVRDDVYKLQTGVLIRWLERPLTSTPPLCYSRARDNLVEDIRCGRLAKATARAANDFKNRCSIH